MPQGCGNCKKMPPLKLVLKNCSHIFNGKNIPLKFKKPKLCSMLQKLSCSHALSSSLWAVVSLFSGDGILPLADSLIFSPRPSLSVSLCLSLSLSFRPSCSLLSPSPSLSLRSIVSFPLLRQGWEHSPLFLMGQ